MDQKDNPKGGATQIKGIFPRGGNKEIFLRGSVRILR